MCPALKSVANLTVCAVLSLSVMSDSLQPHGLLPTKLLHPWGFSKQECWSELPCPPPGDLPNPDIKPRSPALHVDSLSSELQVYQIHHAVYLKYKQFSFYKLYYKIGARKLGLGPRGWVWFLQGPRSFSLIFSKSELFLWCP